MFCNVFVSFTSKLENISEHKEDKQVKSIIREIAYLPKRKDNARSSEEDTTIFEGNPSKEGTSKKNDNVICKSFF
jgi:hypothetical protein